MNAILRTAVVGLALVAFAFATNVSAQSKDVSIIGTWKLNVAKSQFSPGPTPRSLTVKFEPAGEGVRSTTEGVDAEGKPSATEYTANFDGKDYPIKGSSAMDTVSLRRIDAMTVERTNKKGGKVVGTQVRTLAKDGASFTVVIKGTNAKGEPVNNFLFLERQ